MPTQYSGQCHCGAVTFTFSYDALDRGLRCDCSFCKRRGAVMTPFTLAPQALDIVAAPGTLGVYQFDNGVARHYFCKTCGIYPFHQTLRKPGEYRVNLGCVDAIDTEALPVDVFHGKDL